MRLPLLAAVLLIPVATAIAQEQVPFRPRRFRRQEIERRLLGNSSTTNGEDWLQFSRGAESAKPFHTRLDRSKVRSLAPSFEVVLPAECDSSPVYVSDVETTAGRRDLLVVQSTDGGLFGLNAHNGAIIWSTEPPTPLRWTTSSPAIDPERRFVYAYALDGYIHKYLLSDGTEYTGYGWPALVTRKGSVEKGSSPLTIATAKNGRSYLYMTTAGYPVPGDAGDYQGHLTTVELSTGRQRVFNAACSDMTIHFLDNGNPSNDCSNVQAGIWARAGVVYDPITDRIFLTTGNGVFDGVYNWADSIIALRPDGSSDGGIPVDSYTPTDFQNITDADLDLSSTTVAILPSSGSAHLGVQSGKDGLLRLVDLTNLSQQGGPGNLAGELQILPVPQGGGVFSRLVTWQNPADNGSWVFVANYRGLSALSLVSNNDGTAALEPRWSNAALAGSSPIMVDAILFMANDGEIRAVDPLSGDVLWRSNTIGPIHWSSPIWANDMLYILDGDRTLHAFEVSKPSS
jgi:outer membrane protein assembly factor BamB